MTSTKFEDEVKASHCPKCGSGSLVGVRDRSGQWRVHCMDCGAATTGHRSNKDALEAWNAGRTA